MNKTKKEAKKIGKRDIKQAEDLKEIIKRIKGGK